MGGFGLVGFGILDSSFLFMPLGNDLLLIILTARKPELFWYYALMATLGSAIGSMLTDVVSRKLGESGMAHMVHPQRLKSLQKKIERHAWWVLGIAALMPPPFPFTIFLIAAAGLQMSRWKLLAAVCTGRLVRFFTISLLAAHYGRQVLRIARRPEVENVVIGLAILSIVGSVLSLIKWIRSTRARRASTAYSASRL